MNSEKQEQTRLLIYSLSLHALLLVILLISLQDKSLFTPRQMPAPVIFKDIPEIQKKLRKLRTPPQEKKEETQPLDPNAFTVPVPVMYYGNEVDPNKTPGSPGVKKENHADAVTTPEKLLPTPLLPTELIQIAKTPHEPELPTQENVIQEEIQQPSLPEKNNIAQEEIMPFERLDKSTSLFTPQEPLSTPPKKSLSHHQNSEVKKSSLHKQLTLADLFKKPFIEQSSEPSLIGEGSGQPIVIKEGDMRYYSVWTKFLHHLNQTAQFNRIKKHIPLIDWVRSGLLKKDLFCGITVTKEGQVLAIDIISSSGYKPFDDICIQDIWAASPFPPLPDSMKKEQARFEVRSHI